MALVRDVAVNVIELTRLVCDLGRDLSWNDGQRLR